MDDEDGRQGRRGGASVSITDDASASSSWARSCPSSEEAAYVWLRLLDMHQIEGATLTSNTASKHWLTRTEFLRISNSLVRLDGYRKDVEMTRILDVLDNKNKDRITLPDFQKGVEKTPFCRMLVKEVMSPNPSNPVAVSTVYMKSEKDNMADEDARDRDPVRGAGSADHLMYENGFTFTVPESYDFERSTEENYSLDGPLRPHLSSHARPVESTMITHRSESPFTGIYKEVRAQRDYSYHGLYTFERQRWQDACIRKSVLLGRDQMVSG